MAGEIPNRQILIPRILLVVRPTTLGVHRMTHGVIQTTGDRIHIATHQGAAAHIVAVEEAEPVLAHLQVRALMVEPGAGIN